MPTIIPPPLDTHLLTLINLAVQEDLIGPGNGPLSDKTVELAIPSSTHATGTIVARKPGILAGAFLLPAILERYHSFGLANIDLLALDGARLSPNQPIAKLTGSARTILAAERTLLNFLGHLSGIATATATYVDAIADIHATPHGPPLIVDTRKTTPAFRELDKYAVRCGGGHNHRMGLYDGVMLKDNHLAALREKLGAGLTLAQLTKKIRADLDPAILLWLEVDTLDQLAQELASGDAQGGADIILLDNFTPAQMRQAVHMRNTQSSVLSPHHSPLLEASGGITLANLREIASTGIDRIAIGALTHSAPILDISMDFQ